MPFPQPALSLTIANTFPQIVLKNAPMSFAVILQTETSHVASKTIVSACMLTS